MSSFKVVDRSLFPNWPKTDSALRYEWHMDGDNHEWRECVFFVINILSKFFDISEVSVPPFQEGEDLVEIKYNIGDIQVVFSNDATLSLVWLSVVDGEQLKRIENILVEEVGLEK